MAHNLKFDPAVLQEIRKMNPRLMSYNVEMTEVTGGTFWKAYTEGQIAGTEEFPKLEGSFSNHTAMAGLMQYYPPIDTTNEKLIKLAKEFGPVWVRVSGTWATKTYYDFDGTTGGKAPEGYQSVLTREQWSNILGFVKAVDAKLLVSVSNCAGDHDENNGPIRLTQIEKLFNLTDELGGKIDALEFMNEPNMLQISGAPIGYDFPDFIRDQDIINGWVRDNHPDCLIVGPCNTGLTEEKSEGEAGDMGAGMGNMFKLGTAHDVLRGHKVKMDVYSYHYYNGISERLAGMMPTGHWPGEMAHTDAYLQVAPGICYSNISVRDKYVPGAEMWVTESGDAGGGGDTWASTYLDVLRTLNELGSFCTLTNGVIFHNTLASSDYGFLQHGTFDPRPNYFAVLLWTRLMGDTVYSCNNPNVEGAHLYCHSRKDGKEGYTYLLINNSLTDTTNVELPGEATLYELSGNGNMRNKTMYLNGNPLVLGENNELPCLCGKKVNGSVSIAPGSCAFIVI